MCRALAKEIFETVPHSRESSLAITHLEDCRMSAITGIVINDPASEMIADDDTVVGMSGTCCTEKEDCCQGKEVSEAMTEAAATN